MAKLDDLKAQLLPLIKKLAWIELSEPVKLASGKMSVLYLDGRKVTLDPEGGTLFARAVLELADVSQIDAVGGPSIGADPIATAVSILALQEKKKKIPAFLIRKEPKAHGLQNRIEGADLKKGMNVLIVEDVVTTGASVLKAIAAVAKTGVTIRQVISMIDRGEGGREALRAYQYTPLFSLDEVEQ